MHPSIETYSNKLKEKLPTDEEKISMIMTLMGCTAELLDYLSSKSMLYELPIKLRYHASLLASNIVSLTTDLPCTPKDYSENFIMGEQEQERYYRLHKEIVTYLWERLQKEESELK